VEKEEGGTGDHVIKKTPEELQGEDSTRKKKECVEPRGQKGQVLMQRKRLARCEKYGKVIRSPFWPEIRMSLSTVCYRGDQKGIRGINTR